MADIDDRIADIYASLDKSIRDSKSEEDFIPEFKGKVRAAMEGAGIPYTNEAFSEAVAIISKTVMGKNNTTYDSIDSLVADSFSKISIREIERLKSETPRTAADTAKDIAAAAIGAKIAETVLSTVELHNRIANYKNLTFDQISEIYQNWGEVSTEDRITMLENTRTKAKESKAFTSKEKESNERFFAGAKAREESHMDETWQKLSKDEDFAKKYVENRLLSTNDDILRKRIKTMVLLGTPYVEIYEEIERITNEKIAAGAESIEAQVAKEKAKCKVSYGYISPEAIKEENPTITEEEAEKLADQYSQPYQSVTKGYGYNYDNIDRLHDEISASMRDGYDAIYNISQQPGYNIEDITSRYEAIGIKKIEMEEAFVQITGMKEGKTKDSFKFGIKSVISSLDKNTDIKTIEEALKLYSDKMKSIFEDKDLAENVKNMGIKEKNAFIKNLIEEARKSESIPKDVLTVYEKLMNSSFKPETKKILKDDKSMSEYLEYISQPELAKTIKQGIEDRDKPKEGQEPEQPKEDTPTQPQEAPVPIGNAQMNLLMDLVGGHADGPELPTFWPGGRESLINKEKEKISKVNSMENYLGKVVEGGPVTYEDIKDRSEKKDILHDFETAEPLEYTEQPAEAVNELLVGPRGKKLVRNPEEMIQEEVNPMEEATPNEPDISNEGEAPKGPEEGISAPEEPAEINEPETQGVEDAFETAPSGNGDIGIDETIPEVEEPAEEVMQEAITQEDVGEMVQEAGETPEEPQFEEADMVEEAPVPAVISDRQGQLKKISENVPMRAVREMMDHIKQKMIELKDKITGKNKNPEDRENNDDDFTQ